MTYLSSSCFKVSIHIPLTKNVLMFTFPSDSPIVPLNPCKLPPVFTIYTFASSLHSILPFSLIAARRSINDPIKKSAARLSSSSPSFRSRIQFIVFDLNTYLLIHCTYLSGYIYPSRDRFDTARRFVLSSRMIPFRRKEGKVEKCCFWILDRDFL